MSISKPPSTVAQLKQVLQFHSKSIPKLHEDDKEPLVELLIEFSKNVIQPFVKHEQLYPNCHPAIHPPSNSEELKTIQTTLQALSKAVTGLQKKPSPPSKPPQPANPMPSYAGKASSKPDNLSLVIALSHIADETDFHQPRPVEICTALNNALSFSPHNQVHISASRWTAKGNLVVTGGHQTTAHQLQLASPSIAQAFSTAFSSDVTPIASPHTRANVKWTKILINSLPTGVSNNRGVYTPYECQQALSSENPSYAPLIIAQKPSWVKAPPSYSHGSSSSLVVAFEDPDGTKARALLGAKHLYAFGTHATLRKWKQRPTTLSPTRDTTPPPPLVSILDAILSSLSPGTLPAKTKPVTRQSAARLPKAKAKDKT
jgi:hypothetical protein